MALKATIPWRLRFKACEEKREGNGYFDFPVYGGP
jgi:hypothetical protein